MARITINTDWFCSLDTFSDEIKQCVYYAAIVYMSEGVITDMDATCTMLFGLVKKEIDKAKEISEKRRNAGSKGGQKSMNLLKQNNTNESFAQANNDFARPKDEFAQAKQEFAQASEDPWIDLKEEVTFLSPTPSIISLEETTPQENNLKEKTPLGVKKKAPKRKYSDEVSLTEKEYDTLVARHGVEATQWMIEKLNAYKLSKGKTYKSDYGAINSWVVDKYEEYKQKQTRQQPQSGMDVYYDAAAKLARGELL